MMIDNGIIMIISTFRLFLDQRRGKINEKNRFFSVNNFLRKNSENCIWAKGKWIYALEINIHEKVVAPQQKNKRPVPIIDKCDSTVSMLF